MAKIRLLNDGGYHGGRRVKFPVELTAMTKRDGSFRVMGECLINAGFAARSFSPNHMYFFGRSSCEVISND